MSTPSIDGIEKLDLFGCCVDLVRKRISSRSGDSTTLTNKERDLLAYLAVRPGQAVSREALLAQVWSYNPNTESRTLDTTIRRLRRKIERDPKNPDHVITVQGVGYRFQPAPEEIEDRPFVGRENELDMLQTLFSGETKRLVTLVGPPGVGKTRLVQAFVANQRRPVVTVELAHVTSDAGVENAVLARFSAGGRPPNEVLEALTGALFVLDNAEHVVEGVRALVRRCDVDWLVTSRKALEVARERVMPLSTLGPVPGRALFLQLVPHPADPDLVDEIVEAVAGLPLAIELAAGQAMFAGERELLRRLRRSHAVLSRKTAARHPNLLAAIDTSWQLLEPEARRALIACAAFRGPFSVDMLEVVGDFDAVTQVYSLVSSSLLSRRVTPTGGTRFSMLPSVRHFVVTAANAGDQWIEVTQRHLDLFVSKTKIALESNAVDTAWLIREEANLFAARREAVRAGDSEKELWLVTGLACCHHAGPEALGQLEAAIDALPSALVGTLVWGVAMWARGSLVWRMERVDDALQIWRETERQCEVLSVRQFVAGDRISVALKMSGVKEATTLLIAYEQLDPPMAELCYYRARLHTRAGRPEQAEASFRQCASLAGDAVASFHALMRFGQLLFQAQRGAEAVPVFEQARAMCERMEYLEGIGLMDTRLGATFAFEGRPVDANEAFDRSRPLLKNHPPRYGGMCYQRGLALTLQRRFADAAESFSEALVWMPRVWPETTTRVPIHHAAVLCALRQPNQANVALNAVNESRLPPRSQALVTTVRDMVRWLGREVDLAALEGHLRDLWAQIDENPGFRYDAVAVVTALEHLLGETRGDARRWRDVG